MSNLCNSFSSPCAVDTYIDRYTVIIKHKLLWCLNLMVHKITNETCCVQLQTNPGTRTHAKGYKLQLTILFHLQLEFQFHSCLPFSKTKFSNCYPSVQILTQTYLRPPQKRTEICIFLSLSKNPKKRTFSIIPNRASYVENTGSFLHILQIHHKNFPK